MGKNLLICCKNWASRMLVLAAIACATVCVSCSDEFDDTQLKNDIKDLQDRVGALEEKLTSEIESLRTLINGKITVDTFGYNEDTGIYSIKLSDGNILQVAKADATTNPIVSVVLEDGNYYWTVNGKPLLDAEGQKLPVEVAPGVRVNPSTDMWEISPDGGRTWLTTGIKATSEDAAIISKVNDDNSYVYFTLADGTRIQVAKTIDYRCAVLASKQYFAAGTTRKVNIDMNGVAKSAIYSKPEGWKASVAENVVSITAPAENVTDAEKSGKVIVQVWFSDRTSDIAEVEVLIGEAPQEIAIDNNLNVSITLRSDLKKEWDEYGDYLGFVCGVRAFDGFTPQTLISEINANDRLKAGGADVNAPLAQLLGSAPEKGRSYVIWSCNKSSSYTYKIEDLIYTVVLVPNIEISTIETTYEDASIVMTPNGISRYYGGMFQKGTSTLEDQIAAIKEESDYATIVNGPYEGLLSKYAMVWNSPWKLAAGKTYVVYAIPVKANRADLSVNDMYSMEIAINPVVIGGTAAVTVSDVIATTTSVKATVTRGAGVYKYYTAYIPIANIGQYQKDEDMLAYLITLKGQTEETYEVKRETLAPETKGQIAAVGIDKTGKAGPIIRKDANTNAVVYNDKTVKVEQTNLDFNTATFKLTPDAGIVKYRYYTNKQKAWNNDYLCGDGKAATLDKTQNYMATAAVYAYMTQIKEASCEDGKPVDVTLSKLVTGESYVFFAMGFDANGIPTKIVNFGEYMPDFKEGIVRKSSTDWTNSTARPTISNALYDAAPLSKITAEQVKKGGRAVFTATITPGEGCTEFYVILNGVSYFHMSDFLYKTAYVMTSGTKYTETANVTANWYTLDNYVVGIVWKDAAGKLYEADVIDLLADKREDPIL